jgi:hypothetical protein
VAIVVRYFAPAAAGSGDGTSVANSAALFTGGAWSTVITGFNFAGSDSLECRITPGTYTITAALAAAGFANAPTAANPIVLHGADASGNRLTPASPSWTADQPATWDSSLPVLATTTNVNTITLGAAVSFCRLLKFTASATSGSILTSSADWVSVNNSQSNASATGFGSGGFGLARISNCIVRMTGTSYNAGVGVAAGLVRNTRVEGNANASTGTRAGMADSTSQLRLLDRCCILNHAGYGVLDSSSGVGATYDVRNCVIVNCGAAGILLSSTAAQTGQSYVRNNIITGCTTGIDANSGGRLIATNNRIRVSGTAIANTGNYPTDIDNDTSAGSDAAEYNNAAGGDYRIKASASFANRNIGVSQISGVIVVED